MPSLRIKGFYLAVATLAAQFFLDWLFIRIKWFTNYTPSGTVNAPPLRIFGFDVRPRATPAATCSCWRSSCVMALVAKNLVRGRIGADVDGDRATWTSPPRSSASGRCAPSSRPSRSARSIAGVAGALWGFVHLGSWEPLAFDINRSFQLLFMVIIGGLGSILGSLPRRRVHRRSCRSCSTRCRPRSACRSDVALASHLEFMIFGALIIFFLIAEPHGLARLWQIGKEKLRLWPFPH